MLQGKELALSIAIPLTIILLLCILSICTFVWRINKIISSINNTSPIVLKQCRLPNKKDNTALDNTVDAGYVVKLKCPKTGNTIECLGTSAEIGIAFLQEYGHSSITSHAPNNNQDLVFYIWNTDSCNYDLLIIPSNTIQSYLTDPPNDIIHPMEMKDAIEKTKNEIYLLQSVLYNVEIHAINTNYSAMNSILEKFISIIHQNISTITNSACHNKFVHPKEYSEHWENCVYLAVALKDTVSSLEANHPMRDGLIKYLNIKQSPITLENHKFSWKELAGESLDLSSVPYIALMQNGKEVSQRRKITTFPTATLSLADGTQEFMKPSYFNTDMDHNSSSSSSSKNKMDMNTYINDGYIFTNDFRQRQEKLYQVFSEDTSLSTTKKKKQNINFSGIPDKVQSMDYNTNVLQISYTPSSDNDITQSSNIWAHVQYLKDYDLSLSHHSSTEAPLKINNVTLHKLHPQNGTPQSISPLSVSVLGDRKYSSRPSGQDTILMLHQNIIIHKIEDKSYDYPIVEIQTLSTARNKAISLQENQSGTQNIITLSYQPMLTTQVKLWGLTHTVMHSMTTSTEIEVDYKALYHTLLQNITESIDFLNTKTHSNLPGDDPNSTIINNLHTIYKDHNDIKSNVVAGIICDIHMFIQFHAIVSSLDLSDISTAKQSIQKAKTACQFKIPSLSLPNHPLNTFFNTYDDLQSNDTLSILHNLQTFCHLDDTVIYIVELSNKLLFNENANILEQSIKQSISSANPSSDGSVSTDVMEEFSFLNNVDADITKTQSTVQQWITANSPQNIIQPSPELDPTNNPPLNANSI